jgi:hypothetical protein
VSRLWEDVSWLHAICRHDDLLAAHGNLKCFLRAGDNFLRAALWRVRARNIVSCRRKTCVASLRSLWMNVAGDEWRGAGTGRSWLMWWRSCSMKCAGSTVGVVGARSSPGHEVTHHRRARLQMSPSPPCRPSVCRGELAAGPRSIARPHGI